MDERITLGSFKREYLAPEEVKLVELSRNWFRRRRQVATYISRMNVGGVTIETSATFPLRLRKHLWNVAVAREIADETIDEIVEGAYDPSYPSEEFIVNKEKVIIYTGERNGEDI